MHRLSSLDQIRALYAERGAAGYGEGVSQLEHALQCAALARADGRPASLIVAALLHDVGHLFEEEAEAVAAVNDHRHEIAGAQALKAVFGEEVRAPIALHVAAKRYLCCREPRYRASLSPASQRSLALQGGPFTAEEADAFERRPYWRDAVALRRYDDLGKRLDAAGLAFDDFGPLMAALVEPR